MDFNITQLKKEYENFSKKYALPSFDELNKEFEIGKIEKDVGAFLRVVRKLMMEKIGNSLNFVEMFLNPINIPRIYLPFIRTITLDDKKRIDNLYNKLSELVVLSLEREIDYNEEKEAGLISLTFKIWKSLKSDFLSILNSIKNPPAPEKKERSYFG